MAVVAPMPSARVRTMVREKPGAFRSWRIARRRSRIGKHPCSARGGQWISASPRDAKHQPNGKCSQLQILNVKCFELGSVRSSDHLSPTGICYVRLRLQSRDLHSRQRARSASAHFESHRLRCRTDVRIVVFVCARCESLRMDRVFCPQSVPHFERIARRDRVEI